MDFFNTMLLLAELGSKIGNIDIDKKFDLKNFKQLNNLSFVKHIPEFDNNRNYILINGQKAFSGTIIKRPLVIKKATLINVEYHYAAVLGTSIDGREILIEMTKGRDVNIITKQEFLSNRFQEFHIEIYTKPPQHINRELIIEKAKQFQFDIYDLLDLNCKVFVENIILDILPPKRKLEVKQFQLLLCDLKISIYRLQLSSPDNKDYYKFIKEKIKEAEEDKVRLTKAIKEQTQLSVD